MTEESKPGVSEKISNVVENLACRIAEKHAGRLTSNHLIPYLPVSLELVRTCLDAMVDGSSVLSEESDGINGYVFTAYQKGKPVPGHLEIEACVACGKDFEGDLSGVLCPECEKPVTEELNRLAEKNAWPAQAVYEHEILYLAANHNGPIHAEDIAGKSRYTLRNMRRKLERLSVDHYIHQELDEDSGLITFHFPNVDYPKERFRRNMSVIQAYPASREEEIEIKVVRIFMTLGLMLLAVLGLAFMHVPFPLLIVGFIIAAPIVSLFILGHRSPPLED